MTKKAALELLKNRKVYVNGKSAEIQKKLFELGYKWRGDSSQVVAHIIKPFIFIDDKLSLGCADDMIFFYTHESEEISAEEILSIEIEPEFKENDILTAGWEDKNNKAKWVFIYKDYSEGNDEYPCGKYLEKASLMLESSTGSLPITFDDFCTAQEWVRPATEDEIKVLLKALIESSNPKAKTILEEVFYLNKFEPFDKVLVRNSIDEAWRPKFFGRLTTDLKYPYRDIYEYDYKYCISFEENKALAYTS